MKKLFIYLAVVIGMLGAEEAKPTPEMPSEITLTSGRVLRNVKVIRWERERVVLKHSAGADPIAFTLIKSIPLEQLHAMQDAAINAAGRAAAETRKKQAADKVASEIKRYEGQIFIVTKGAGSYKMAGTIFRVYYKPVSDIRDTFKWSSFPPKADDIGTTDSEGRFSFEAPPSGPITIVAKDQRLVGANPQYNNERYLWIVSVDEMKDRFHPILSNSNMEHGSMLESGAYNRL